MTIEMIKAMFDACYLAGRTRAMLPALPEGVTSSYIHYLDVIDSLERQGLRVRVSDIGEKLDISAPRRDAHGQGNGKPRLSPQNGVRQRTGAWSTSPRPRQESSCRKRYNRGLFSPSLAPQLADISDEDAASAIRTIQKRCTDVMSREEGSPLSRITKRILRREAYSKKLSLGSCCRCSAH